MKTFVFVLIVLEALFKVGSCLTLQVSLGENNQVCEATPVNSKIGTFTARDGEALPYQFTVLTPEFSAYVELENGGVANSEVGTVDVYLSRELDRESTTAFQNIDVQVTSGRQNQVFMILPWLVEPELFIGWHTVFWGMSSIHGLVDLDWRLQKLQKLIFQSHALERVSVLVVVDANDNPPNFSNIPYTTSVYEYPWTNDLNIVVSVSDPDDGSSGRVDVNLNNNRLELEGNGPNYNLRLKAGEELDYETSPVLTAVITATDGGSSTGCGDASPRSSETTAVINIMDGPDNAPVFATTYDVTIDEGTKVGVEFLVVEAIDRDYTLAWKMKYEIVKDGVAEIWFDINEATGAISAKKEIDREDDSVLANGGNFRFEVKATEIVPDDFELQPTPEMQFPFSVQTFVTVRIEDVNDNPPVFYEESSGILEEKSNFVAYMDENTPELISVPGVSILVKDKDQGENADFSLEDNSDAFDVFPEQVSGEVGVVLRVADSSALDFETTKEFTVEIVARETGQNAMHSATATVTIYLNDTNDNSPVFKNLPLEANITEDASSGTQVIEIQAMDNDTGVNSEITYSLQSNAVFSIDETTGSITLKGELNRESISSYSLTVSARDGGGRETNANLQVSVLDVNDNAPSFQRLSYSGIVSEDADDFTTPLEITANDLDEAGTPNSEIEFVIVGGDLQSYFSVAVTESSELVTIGSVKPKAPIDVEDLDPVFTEDCTGGAITGTVVVEARDKGSPPQSSNVTITITIQDVNDRSPSFDQSQYEATVPEFSLSNTYVLEVSATDMDACSPNNLFNYQIDPENTEAVSAFSINSQTGNISVRSPDLDRDIKETYEFLILATDSANNQGTATVIITLTDVNDKVPEFPSDQDSTVEIEEEQQVGTVVWSVTAIDTDDDSNLEYSKDNVRCFDIENVEDTIDCEDPFTLQTVNQEGQFVVAKRINREQFSRYLITVTVEDLNVCVNDQTASKVFEILLTDINDNTPTFAEDNNVFEVEEHAQNAVIGVVTATDPDKGDNGVVKYSIEDQYKSLLSINVDNGLITTTPEGNIDREDKETGNWLNVTVFAKDLGNSTNSNSTEIYIRILDINDNDPAFEEMEYSASIPEDAEIGTEVVTVRATDEDEGGSDQIRYFITAGDSFGQFDINDTTGIINVARSLDREETPQGYSLTITARDERGSNNGREDTTSVIIDLSDVNDSPPEFPSAIYVVYNFPEDAPEGRTVDSQTATDADLGINAEIVYSIIDQDEGDHFSINVDTGEVTLAKSIRNGEEVYNVEIMGEDKGTPSLNSSYLLEIRVEDANLNDPQFENLPPIEDVSISEGLPPNQEVYQVNATDADRGLNGEIRYTIESEDDAFSINQDNGIIFSSFTFNREFKDSFAVSVTASDKSLAVILSTTIDFIIYIADVDDNDPYYLPNENEQNITVVEETEVGLLQVTVQQAYDDDTEENSVNYYFIIGGTAAGQFSLNATSRELFLNNALDREADIEYDLVITVRKDLDFVPPEPNVDWGGQVQNDPSNLHVLFNLVDINDQSPVFVQQEYLADIPFDSQANPDATIIRVLAVDDDEGLNAEVEYAIVSTQYIQSDGSTTNPPVNTFGIQKARDGISGDLYLNGVINGDTGGRYVVIVSATDRGGNDGQATITVGVISVDESVTLYSSISPEEFDSEKFRTELGKLLNAIVIMDSIEPHVPQEGVSTLARSDVTFHAKEEGSTELVESDVIASELSKQENSAFLNEYGIVGFQQDPLPVEDPAEILKIVLLAVIVVAVIAFVCFSLALIFMRRKYNRKLKVAEATTSAANEMADMNVQKSVPVLPNTNDFAGGENPLFIENQKAAIDLEGWYNHQESQDDDDGIDDNAVDDSAIALGSDKNSVQSDDGQNLDDGGFEIDFEKGDRSQLAAALNAANKRRGGDDLTFMFDQDMDNTAM